MNTYDVVINGVATTLQLTDEDAKSRGLLPEPKVAKAAPVAKAAKAPANKARTAAANKSGNAGS